jgi:hypothetical protein
LLETKSDGPANDQRTSQPNIRLRLRRNVGAGG